MNQQPSRYPKPEVGMGATIAMYTDRHAATIAAVVGKEVWVRQDIAKRTDANGMSESQAYQYFTDPTAPIEKFSLRRDGTYVKVGRKIGQGPRLWVGIRHQYYDFGF